MKFEKDIQLSKLNTLKAGNSARFFGIVKNTDDIREAINFANENKLKVGIIGGGSNTLFSGGDFEGLLIKVENESIKFQDECCNKVKVIADAGVNWDNLVSQCVEKGLYGFENMSGIPGTVGGAVFGNIGAYGKEIGDFVFTVEVFDPETGTIKIFSNYECYFNYRDSVFKKINNRNLIIVSATFILRKEGDINFDYKDLKEYFNKREIKSPSLIEIRNAVLEVRANKLPDLSKFGTAGSFWKNPIIKKSKYDELLKRYDDMPAFSAGSIPAEKAGPEDFVKVPLAWILDKVCNLKGYKKGKVGLYENQPLVLINYGGASTREIIDFSEEIASIVFDKTGIKIEKEVEMIG